MGRVFCYDSNKDFATNNFSGQQYGCIASILHFFMTSIQCQCPLWNRHAGFWLTNSAFFRAELLSWELPNRSHMKLRFYFSLQLHNIVQSAGEMDVSSHRVAVIRFPSRELWLKLWARYSQLHHNDFSWFKLKSLQKQISCIGFIFTAKLKINRNTATVK